MSAPTASSVDRNRSTRASQIYFDRLSEGSLIPFILLRRRPQAPRGFVFRDGLLQWEEPREIRNVHYYNIYINSEAAPAFRVPVGQTQAKVPEPEHGARQAWISAVNDRNGMESSKAYTDIRIPPPAPVAAAAAGNPGTVNFTPMAGPYATIGFRDFTLTGKADLLHMVAWYVDEASTDLLYGVLGAAMDATSDPVSLSVTVFNKERDDILPIFATGDLVVFDDPSQDTVNPVSDPGTIRKYEVATVGTITGDQPGTVTMQFLTRGGLGSFKVAHEAGRRFYRLRAQHFSIPTKDNAGNDKIFSEEHRPIFSACVVAMALAASDLGVIGTYNLKNCSQLAYKFPGDPHENNPAPGFRTCDAGDYRFLMSGALSVGQSSGVPLWVNNTGSIRDIVAVLGVPAEGSAAVYNGVLASMTDVAIVVYIICIEPVTPILPYRDRRVGILDQIAFKENEYHTFPASNPPNALEGQRRMPYLPKWPTRSCPVVGTVESIFDPDTGLLRSNVLPFVDQGEVIDFEEGCQIDAIVALVGSNASGFNMEVTILT